MNKRTIAFIFFLAAAIITALSSCGNSTAYTAGMERETKKTFSRLLVSLDSTEDYEKNYIAMMQLLNILKQNSDSSTLNLFLTNYTEKMPDDPFNAYYLLIVARNYMEEGAVPFALYYFDRILRNNKDVIIMGDSVHLICLKTIIKHTNNPEEKIACYKDIIARFGSEIDPGEIYYYLGETYGEIGDWELAIQAYKKFLNYPDTAIPGNSTAHEHIQNIIAYYNTKVTWTFENLDELIQKVSNAIKRGRSTQSMIELKKYISGVNFFMVSWEEQENNSELLFVDNIGSFLNYNIRVNANIDQLSNSQEAYLRTEGWTYRINTWYLYFRRINFLADPEIHGNWEWAGIYFGERVFSKSYED